MKYKIQVLVAAMNQTDTSLPDKMNLQTDAIIGNQCDRNEISQIEYNGNIIKYLSFAERGVGLNRNNCLMRANGDICLLADEDMTYCDGYDKIVKEAFDKLPDADAIIFNIKVNNERNTNRYNTKIRRARIYNAFNYGAVRIAFKNLSIKRENINFHRCFGGGTKFSAGEDTLFISELLKKGLKVYTYPKCIGIVNQSDSTWFTGYNKKYFYDKGAFFAAMLPAFAKILCIYSLVKYKDLHKKAGLSFLDAYKIMKDGIKGFKNLDEYIE